MVHGIIYKICFPLGKHYIGLTTTSLKQRQKEHKILAKNGDTRCVYKALRKYNIVDTFKLEKIDIADTLEELCQKEKEYITKFNSYYKNNKGYNMTYGGEGTNGYTLTEEQKQKLSEISIKQWADSEARAKMSEIKKQYFQENPQAGKEHGERMKQYYEENPEARAQMSEIKKQYFQENPQVKEQISERSIKQWADPEAKEQMSEIKKQYYENNPQAGKEHGERMKQYYEENPEARAQMSEIKKQYYEENPEARKQMSEIKKQYYEENPETIKKTLDTMGKNKPFDIFTKDGTFIKTFTYQFEAKKYLQKEYKIKKTISIGQVLLGKLTTSAGFIFKYKEDM